MDNQDKIVTFATYYDPMLAQIIRARLEDNDIPCFIADENMIGINPLYNNALGGIKIKVFERDVEKCTLMLAEQSIVPKDSEVSVEASVQKNRCPFCNATDIRYGSATETRFGWWSWISWLPSFIFSIAVLPFVTRKAWHCFNCGQDFAEPINEAGVDQI